MSDLATTGNRALARPLKVLAALIKEQILLAKEDAKRAAAPRWKTIGALLNEAQISGEGMSIAELVQWGKEQFGFSRSYLLRLKELDSSPIDLSRASTFSEASRAIGKDPGGHGPTWKDPLQKKMQAFNWDRYNQEEAAKAKERELIKKLALEMIDIGYKVLAIKLHPDKPTGSKEGFQRLKEAHRLAKERVG